jgi:hypothetical protein
MIAPIYLKSARSHTPHPRSIGAPYGRAPALFCAIQIRRSISAHERALAQSYQFQKTSLLYLISNELEALRATQSINHCSEGKTKSHNHFNSTSTAFSQLFMPTSFKASS